MESLRTQQDVNATGDVLWSVLQDGAQYCTWVPGVEDVEGDVEDGQAITLVSDGGRERTSVKIEATTNRRLMTWRTGAGLGLDSTELTFDVADTGFGCTVVLTRTDGGLLHGLFGADGDGDPKERLDALAAALAAAGEARASRRETRRAVEDEPGGTGPADAPGSALNPGAAAVEPDGD
ncbi:SRPBCC family protein [Arthrobacter sp.]|uniref:SRPBCC family protein n=1 Tax=Arthrobacter sp. TaxID=1667 RepID=UPI003A90BC7E